MAKGVKTGGRKKGTPNKTTAKVKDAIMEAFDKAGGVDYLVGIAREDPKTFCSLLGRVLPSEVKAELTGADGAQLFPDTIRFEIVKPDEAKD